jgi:hypothetical protein
VTPPSYRLSRARDFSLISAGAACFVLAAVFSAGGIWFRALFVAALGAEPLLFSGGFLVAAIGLGIAHALARPPLP